MDKCPSFKLLLQYVNTTLTLHDITLQLATKMKKNVHHAKWKREIMCLVQKVQCVSEKQTIAAHTHKQQARQGPLLTAWPSPFHACICMVYNVFLHPLWSYIISNTFRCVWTPASFFCTLWTCSVLPTYDMYLSFRKINFVVLVAAVSGFWLSSSSSSSSWLSWPSLCTEFTKQTVSGFTSWFFFLLSNYLN